MTDLSSMKTVTVEEVFEKLSSADPPVILDVREPHELAGELGHIKGAINIPIDRMGMRTRELRSSMDKEIVCVCRSDARAGDVARMLTQFGFSQIKVMTGGMIEWNNAKYPVER
ncbi:MAG: rhodanese-like domain-containing protein [Thermodesulfobacteriota bacterium]